jgi:hypothetical protein
MSKVKFRISGNGIVHRRASDILKSSEVRGRVTKPAENSGQFVTAKNGQLKVRDNINLSVKFTTDSSIKADSKSSIKETSPKSSKPEVAAG